MENINPFDSPELDKIKEKYSPFFRETRKRILATLAVFAFFTIFGFIFYEDIIRFLVGTLSLEKVNIVFTSPFQFINLAISCGLVTGLLVALPLLIIQVLYFLKPALIKTEYKTLINLLPFSIFLFLIGFAFGSVIMKWQIEIFLSRAISLGIGNILDISSLLVTVFLTSALMGLGFQFPIVLLLLMRFNILKYQDVSKKRPWIYLGSFVFTLFLPPDSILADIFLSLPLIFLFEITLILYRALERKRSKGETRGRLVTNKQSGQ